MKVAASPRSMAQVAAVLAFVISHTTFLAAQDDETGRCPKMVCKSLAASHSSPISSPISLNRAIQSFASSFFTIWIAMPAWTRT